MRLIACGEGRTRIGLGSCPTLSPKLLAAVAAGAVPPDVGQQIITAIGTLSQARVTEELAAEVAALKAKDVTP